MEKSIDARKQRWIDFFDLSSKTNRLLVVKCTQNMPPNPLLWWEKAGERIEWSYERYMRQMEQLSWLHDDRVPALAMSTGTEIFAEAFGCPVHKPAQGTPFARPLVSTAQEANRIKLPRVEDTRLMTLFDMANELRRRAGEDALLGLPDVQTPMDIAALIWDKADLFVAMYDEPEAVKELSFKIKTFMFAFFDLWFKTFGAAHSAHYPDYYMPYGITISEDEIGAVNADMYRQFFEEELHAFSARYGAIGIHCCANASHQWENLAAVPNLRLLNICQPPKQTQESISYFRHVCSQYPGEVNIKLDAMDEPEQIHLAQSIQVATRDEAEAAVIRFYEKGQL